MGDNKEMGFTEIMSVFGILLGVVDKVLSKMPEYDQRKKEEFYDLKKRYEDEKAKDALHRDDLTIDQCYSDLVRFCEIFRDEIQ